MINIDADRWRRLRPLLDRAIGLEGEERTAFLRTLHGETEALRDDLARLLAEHDRLQGRIVPNALNVVTRAIARESRDERMQHDIPTNEATDPGP